MKIMVIGSGGREHAIIKKLLESPKVEKIYALPGNGGISADAECVNIGAKDIESITKFAVQNKIDYAVVTPDDPLVLGAVDSLCAAGIPCFGPDKKAAVIEGSKTFSKNLMKKYGIPTAKYEIFTSSEKAIEYLKTASFPIVIKADGLALGKGVVIAEALAEAEAAVIAAIDEKVFGESGNTVVIEEFLKGPEISVLAFTDGKTLVPMISSMDHKRAQNDDCGLNTGGMGTIAPNPFYTDEIAIECMQKIFLPTVAAMNAENREFRGCLYFGLMLTEDGPKVIEYNCRFGDPETQVVLPLLKSDLLEIMLAVTNGKLTPELVEFSDRSACCVIAASNGYPQKYEKGYQISLRKPSENTEIYISGAVLKGEALVTSGGRVLGVTSVADTLDNAISTSYKYLSEGLLFENEYYRTDIGKRALKYLNGEK